MTTIIGIDPGLQGAIAFAFIDSTARVYCTPTVYSAKGRREYDEPAMRERLLSTFAVRSTLHAFIERQQTMRLGPDKAPPAIAQFRKGEGYGLWRGLLVGLGISYTVVGPRTWQKLMLRDVDKSDTKAASIIVAKRLFPDVRLRHSDRCTKDNHNFADALLIAEYGRRTLGSGQ